MFFFPHLICYHRPHVNHLFSRTPVKLWKTFTIIPAFDFTKIIIIYPWGEFFVRNTTAYSYFSHVFFVEIFGNLSVSKCWNYTWAVSFNFENFEMFFRFHSFPAGISYSEIKYISIQQNYLFLK